MFLLRGVGWKVCNIVNVLYLFFQEHFPNLTYVIRFNAMTSNAEGDRNSSSGCAVGMKGGQNDYAACDDFVRVKSTSIGQVEFPRAVVLAWDPLVGPAATLSSGNGC
jgi:hypothetical protein